MLLITHYKRRRSEHIGLSRNYDCANLKRKLHPAIEELERRRFLQPMTEAERFRKVSSGEWQVLFAEAQTPAAAVPPVEPNGSTPLKAALMERGVSPTAAQDMVTQYPLDRIRSQLEVFDWLTAQRNAKVSRNPPGFLVASIRGEYAPPKGFISQEDRERRAKETADRQRRIEERRQRQETVRQAKVQAREAAVQQYWQALSEEERNRQEQEALREAKPLEKKLIAKPGPLSEATRKTILDGYALKALQGSS